MLKKYFWFNLCIILFQAIIIAYAEDWRVTYPQEGTEIRENSDIVVCWEVLNKETDNKNLIITIHKKGDSEYSNGFVIGDNINSSTTCYNFNSNKLSKKTENGLKNVIIWDSNKNILAQSPDFVINRKGSNFNFITISYIIIGAAVIVPIGLLLLFNVKKKITETIPTGSRSIPSLTVNRRKTYEPPIKSYRESWIELPQANISSDSIEDVYDYDLLEEAEEAAKSMGLLNQTWIAKKEFIPYRDDELLIRIGDELLVREIYDDLWCYGQNKTLFEEKQKKDNKKFQYNINLSVQENEELMMFGMFPSVVLPIEFKKLKVTKATIQSIREASVVAEPVHDEVQNEEMILKEDPNSVVIKIPSPPENMILPVNNLKRSTSLRSSLRRRATKNSNKVSVSSLPIATTQPTPPLPSVPAIPPQPKLAQSVVMDE